MSKYYVEDNTGSDFGSDDEDIDSLLSFAAQGEEDDDEGDTSLYFKQDKVEKVEKKLTPKSIYEDHKPKEVEEEEIQSTDLFDDETNSSDNNSDEDSADDMDLFDDTSEDEETQEETYTTEPEVVVETPKVQEVKEAPISRWSTESEDYGKNFNNIDVQETSENSYETQAARHSTVEQSANNTRRFHIPSEDDQIALAKKIIRISDTFRKLNSEEKVVAEQIITNSDDLTQDEAIIAVKVLNADAMLSITMKSLREAKEANPVDRVFYVISLDDEVMYELGRMVSAFTSEIIDENLGKIDYARQLVENVTNLDNSAVKYIASTESVLAAANNENE